MQIADSNIDNLDKYNFLILLVIFEMLDKFYGRFEEFLPILFHFAFWPVFVYPLGNKNFQNDTRYYDFFLTSNDLMKKFKIHLES